ncbi:N(G),N(G)-dimethylarginine dimethylaminohydrolase [Microbacterium protaetiae]|uniref:N(G),N(G)-dimethylarginine dimethylaminohydrolase n=1 Tax=Microbacterium protaetiae TaxID=2509458 RepID=A0A4P6EHM0_9MICO|nr:dimethylargininase [Microbacterium protaetiae]QAY61013.1 N(G),N(G)-dimethylarginine dimethylaminohydrolase [Microbacterium protaetiae]
MSRLLVRRPSPRLADGELTHLERVPADAALALAQWEGYVDAFRTRGWEIVPLPAADDHPDGVFVEDVVVIFSDLAVITRPGADSRRGEIETAQGVVEASGIETAAIQAPGTLEGGDVLKVGRTVYVGRSSRTNDEGIAQLRTLLTPRGWDVVAVPITKVLHLKTGVTALPDGTVIGYEPLVDDVSVYPEFLGIAEPEGSAVVVLDEHSVLISAAAPRTADLLRDRGLDVVAVPISEFEKLEGCVTCLSVRVRD